MLPARTYKMIEYLEYFYAEKYIKTIKKTYKNNVCKHHFLTSYSKEKSVLIVSSLACLMFVDACKNIRKISTNNWKSSNHLELVCHMQWMSVLLFLCLHTEFNVEWHEIFRLLILAVVYYKYEKMSTCEQISIHAKQLFMKSCINQRVGLIFSNMYCKETG